MGRESSVSPGPTPQPSQPPAQPPPSQDEPINEDQEDHSIKGRTRSITEHMTQVDLYVCIVKIPMSSNK